VKKIFLLSFLLAISPNVLAQQTSVQNSGDIVVSSPNKMTVYGGLGLSSFDYKEDFPAPLKSTESGTLATATLGLTKIFSHSDENPTVYRLEGKFSPSSTAFDGTSQKGNPVPGFTRTGTRFFDLEGSALFAMSDKFGLYTGLGYHSWMRSAGDNVPGSYGEFYRWAYVPLGFVYKIQNTDALSIDADFSLRPTFLGQMTAYLADIGNPEFSLGGTVGLKFQVHVKVKTAAASALVFTPWYEASGIGKSNSVDGYFEPSSATSQLGLNMVYEIAL
jgi:hypothetical protein